MDEAGFEKLVNEGIKLIPENFLRQLENVAIVIEDEPTPEQIGKLKLRKDIALFGLYEGVPQTRRGPHYGMTWPDKITIFRKPIEAYAASAEQIREIVKNTVWHEIAHHFGSDEGRVRKAEKERLKADKLYNKGKFAVAEMVETPQGLPLVMDFKKPAPFWKFPGGRSEAGESPAAAAIREIEEEVGLKLKQSDLELVHHEKRLNHEFYFYRARVASLADLKNKGNDGESVRLFTLEQLKTMIDFFPNHRKLIL